MTEALCRICGAAGSLRPWGGITCPACHSVSVESLPTAEELAAFYETFNAAYHGGGRREGAEARQRRYAEAYRAEIRRYATAGSVLDIGPSTNPLPNLLAEDGFDVAVADFVRPPALDARVRFVGASLDDGETLRGELGVGRFDVVSNFAVIEHCRDPRGAARTMADLARPGAHLVLTTPEIGRGADRSFAGRSRWFCPPEHLHLVSKEGMARIFADAGCDLVQARRFELNPLRWLARYGLLEAEGAWGRLTRLVAPARWRRARDEREARGQGIALFVFRRRGGEA